MEYKKFKVIKKKSRFDKVYNYYDLLKEYHRGYMRGSIITAIIILIVLIIMEVI